jgi:hypothetical protein
MCRGGYRRLAIRQERKIIFILIFYLDKSVWNAHFYLDKSVWNPLFRQNVALEKVDTR